MLKNLARLWRKGNIMRAAVNEMATMIRDSGEVFAQAWAGCRGSVEPDTVMTAIKERDKQVNRREREIRRLLVEHLGLNPGDDASGCLALMIMAKDAERVGDHARNVLILAGRARIKIPDMQMFTTLDQVAGTLQTVFPLLAEAILESDEERAHRVMQTYQQIKEQMKGVHDKLLGADLPGHESMLTTLLTRDLARINSHLGNIASGIVFPLEDIDFVSRGLRREQKEDA